MSEFDSLLPQVTRLTFHVTHSLRMFSQLPEQFERVRYRGDQPYPGQDLIQAAVQESWLLHARLLIEFLGVAGQTRSSDFSAANFGWNLPAGDFTDLKAVWQDASRHLVHFSKEREPVDTWSLARGRYGVELMAQVGERVLQLFQAFVDTPNELLDTVRSQYRPEIERATVRISELADLREAAMLETAAMQARMASGN